MEKLRMTPAVKALAVVLDRELPVAEFDQVGLQGYLGVIETVRHQIGGHLCLEIRKILRGLIGQAGEHQAPEPANMNPPQLKLWRNRGACGATTVDDFARGVIGPAVIG